VPTRTRLNIRRTFAHKFLSKERGNGKNAGMLVSLGARRAPAAHAIEAHARARRTDSRTARRPADRGHPAQPGLTSLWIKRMGEGFTRVGEMSPTLASSALSTIAAWRGTILNHQNPILETELPIDGSRFEGIVSPVVRNPVFAIRLRPRKIFTLDEYEQSGILTTDGRSD
jgi:hypothetical protein